MDLIKIMYAYFIVFSIITAILGCYIIVSQIQCMIFDYRLSVINKRHKLFKRSLIAENDISRRFEIICNKYDHSDIYWSDAVLECVIPFVPYSQSIRFYSMLNEDVFDFNCDT